MKDGIFFNKYSDVPRAEQTFLQPYSSEQQCCRVAAWGTEHWRESRELHSDDLVPNEHFFLSIISQGNSNKLILALQTNSAC